MKRIDVCENYLSFTRSVSGKFRLAICMVWLNGFETRTQMTGDVIIISINENQPADVTVFAHFWLSQNNAFITFQLNDFQTEISWRFRWRSTLV